MYDNENYPIGADTKVAPWNREINPFLHFCGEIRCTMKKHGYIASQYYDEEHNLDQLEAVAEYKTNHYTIPDLLAILKGYIERDMVEAKSQPQKKRLELILSDIKDWCEEDTDVELD